FRVFPVTYALIELIRPVLQFFLIVIVIYFSGVLVWKDREDRMDAIMDATPTHEWVSYSARLVALIGILFLILAMAIGPGILFQAFHGFHRFQFALYAKELLL